jgi:hypothetical protein
MNTEPSPIPRRAALLLSGQDGPRRLDLSKRARALSAAITLTFNFETDDQRDLSRDEMIVAAHNQRFDLLVVPSLDVFGTSEIAMGVVAQLHDLEIQIHSLEEPWVGEFQEVVTRLYRWLRRNKDRERSEKIRKSLRESTRQIGRPRKVIDLVKALDLVTTMPISRAAQALGCGATSLRRALKEHEARQAEARRLAA